MEKDFKVSAGLIEHYDDRDFLWTYYKDIIEKPSLGFKKSGEIQYNQKLIHYNSCFLHGPIGAVSDLTGYKFTLKERQHLVSEAYKTEWASPEFGGYFNEACKFLVKWWNENKATKEQWIIYYRIGQQDRNKALDKGYSIVVGHHTNSGFYKDKQDDGIINDSVLHAGKVNGHCERIWKGDKNYMVDNYTGIEGRKNIVEFDKIPEEFFGSGYIFCLKEEVKDGYEGKSVEDKKSQLKARPEAIKNIKQ